MTSLVFKPFYLSSCLIKNYYSAFQKTRKEKRVYDNTPSNKYEVIAWFNEILSNTNTDYYFIFQNDRLIGHCGLREIRHDLHIAKIGLFFMNKRDEKKRSEVLTFCLELARQYTLHLVVAEVPFLNDQFRDHLLKTGFSQDVSGWNWYRFL